MPEGRAAAHASFEPLDRHPGHVAVHLAKRRPLRMRGMQCRVGFHKALAANRTDFDHIPILERRDDRQNGIDRKIHMADNVADRMRMLVGGKGDDVEIGLQIPAIRKRQRIEEQVAATIDRADDWRFRRLREDGLPAS